MAYYNMERGDDWDAWQEFRALLESMSVVTEATRLLLPHWTFIGLKRGRGNICPDRYSEAYRMTSASALCPGGHRGRRATRESGTDH